jgi:hypothetical protein
VRGDLRDDLHGALPAGRADSLGKRIGGRGDVVVDAIVVLRQVSGGAEKLPYQGDPSTPYGVGQEPKVADAHEALGQSVKEKAARELDAVEGHDACAVAMGIVLP